MDKEEQRRHLVQIRANIADRTQKDRRIEQAALRMAENFQSVFVYVSMGSEVGTHGIIQELYGRKKVFVPHTLPDKTMHACELRGNDLTCDAWGNVRSVGTPCDGQAALIFVPLLGYDENCHRIGYGAGCYDRYFSLYPNGQKVGLAYSEQLCSFTHAPFDIPLDCILTPDKCIRREQ